MENTTRYQIDVTDAPRTLAALTHEFGRVVQSMPTVGRIHHAVVDTPAERADYFETMMSQDDNVVSYDSNR